MQSDTGFLCFVTFRVLVRPAKTPEVLQGLPWCSMGTELDAEARYLGIGAVSYLILDLIGPSRYVAWRRLTRNFCDCVHPHQSPSSWPVLLSCLHTPPAEDHR